jgi:hypothetical protein
MTIVGQLLAAGVPDEALGVWRAEKRLFGVPRPPAMDPVGRVWRLGALLVDRDGQLYATGKVTRAIVPKDFNADKSLAGEAHREIQRAASRGAFRPGETVNYEWTRLTPVEAQTLVDPVPLEKYLADRLELLSP